jgi:hypothetical protein
MVTTRGDWLANEKALRKNGFEKTDSAPPAFDLMVKTLGGGSARPPQAAFPSNWEERLGRFPPGVTIVYADQCPYTPDAVKGAVNAFAERGIEARVVWGVRDRVGRKPLLLSLSRPERAQAFG